jgi:hypothetical protein
MIAFLHRLLKYHDDSLRSPDMMSVIVQSSLCCGVTRIGVSYNLFELSSDVDVVFSLERPAINARRERGS